MMRASGAGFVSSARAGNAAAKITAKTAAARKDAPRPATAATALVKCDSFITTLRSSRGCGAGSHAHCKTTSKLWWRRDRTRRGKRPATLYEMELNAEEKFA